MAMMLSPEDVTDHRGLHEHFSERLSFMIKYNNTYIGGLWLSVEVREKAKPSRHITEIRGMERRCG
eukprot:6103077-Pyramimonas_sp.AAC.1